MILTRYFLGEAVKLTAAIVGGLFVVYLSMRFATSLGAAAEGKMAPHHIFQIVMLKMLVSVKDLLPIALFLGTFAATVRLQQGSEWVAMRAAGVSHQQMLRPIFVLGAVGAVVVGIITLGLAPRAELTLRELKEQTENEATVAGVKSGRFQEISSGRRVFYAESVSDDERYLENPFVQNRTGSQTGALRAQRASIQNDAKSGDRFAVFETGTSYAGEPGRLDYVVTDFGRYGIRIENREPTEFGAHVGFIPTTELMALEGSYYKVEFQWRLALPICTLLGPALAVLIGLGSKRGYWYLGLISALSAYFAYTNLLGVGRALMKKEVIPAILGLWPVHLMFCMVLLIVYLWHRRAFRFRRRARQEFIPA